MLRVLIGGLFFCFKCSGQQKIYNPTPSVTLIENKILYKFYDNPIVINTGDKKGLTVQVKNGTLKMAKNNGEFTLRPDSTKWTTEILLKQGNFKRTFEFQNRYFPERVTYRIIGSGENHAFYALEGIYAYIKDFQYAIPFIVDSFLFVQPIADTVETHMNKGNLWAAAVKSWLINAKKGTTFEIRRVYISCGGWNTILTEVQPIYKPEGE